MADITWVTAEIGGGKSLFAVRTACKELARTERAIVNNLPWEMDKLVDWCHEKIEKPVDLRKRLRILTPEEVIEFYRYFPPLTGDIEQTLRDRAKAMPENVPLKRREEWFALAMKNIKCYEEGKLPMEEITGHERPLLTLRQGDGGIFYQLDEVHLSFPARFWQSHGLAVEHYMSQLRKLNDDLMLITQHSGKVDKNFRRNGTEWIVLQNMSKARLIGGVTLSGRFRAHQYPTEPVRGDKPQSSPWFTLDDAGYKTLYNTMAGVGLVGNLNPELSRRKKGRHWVWWIVGLSIMAAIGLFFPTALTRLFGYALGKLIHQFGNGVTKSVQHPVPLSNQNKTVPSTAPKPVSSDSPSGVVPQSLSSAPQLAQVSNDNTNQVVCWGFVYLGNDVDVYLSDGRIAYSEDGDVQQIKHHSVIVFHQTFPVVQKPPVQNDLLIQPIQSNFTPPLVSDAPSTPRDNVQVTYIGSHKQTQTGFNGFNTFNHSGNKQSIQSYNGQSSSQLLNQNNENNN